MASLGLSTSLGRLPPPAAEERSAWQCGGGAIGYPSPERAGRPSGVSPPLRSQSFDRQSLERRGLEPAHASPDGDATVEVGPGSLFGASAGLEWEEVLSTVVAMPLDALQQQLLSMDSDASRFGALFCSRLGYTQLQAGSWDGNETEGLTRTVRLVVKCPPKPMLPDSTRVVIRHRLVRLPSGALLLEREVSTLDVPYGEAFSLQERWVATPGELAAADSDAGDEDDEGEGEGATHALLSVRCRVHFRSRVSVMASSPNPHPSTSPSPNPKPKPEPHSDPDQVSVMASKIRQHSVKGSRKVAELAVELLAQAQAEPAVAPSARQAEVEQRWSSPEAEAYASLHAKYALLLDEVQFHKHRAQSLAVENKRLLSLRFYGSQAKRALVEQLLAAQEALAREKRERAACEEGLSEAYNAHLKMLVEAQGAGGASDADKSKSGRFIKKLQR